MRKRAAIGVLAGVIAILGARPAAADGSSLLARCPAYGEHLRAARAYLARGHREPALVELRRAREALATCGREDEADRSGALAAGGRPTSPG